VITVDLPLTDHENPGLGALTEGALCRAAVLLGGAAAPGCPMGAAARRAQDHDKNINANVARANRKSVALARARSLRARSAIRVAKDRPAGAGLLLAQRGPGELRLSETG